MNQQRLGNERRQRGNVEILFQEVWLGLRETDGSKRVTVGLRRLVSNMFISQRERSSVEGRLEREEVIEE